MRRELNPSIVITRLIGLLLWVGLFSDSVSADIAALGSTARGATSQIGRTVATVVSEAGLLQLRPQELANTADYLPLVNAGEMDFGIANLVQLTHGVRGVGMSAGRPNSHLRMVATLMPFRNAYIVRADSDIYAVSDLLDKRVPVFPKRALGDYISRGFLANADLTPDDVAGVVMPNFQRMWSSFAEGTTDATIIVVGAGNSREFHASFGIRYLSFENTPEALQRMRSWLPGTGLRKLPGGSVPGMGQETVVNAFDYTLFAGSDVSEQVVYNTVRALWHGEDALLAAGLLWNGFARENMGKDVGLAYHPGAIRFYRDMGVWEE